MIRELKQIACFLVINKMIQILNFYHESTRQIGYMYDTRLYDLLILWKIQQNTRGYESYTNYQSASFLYHLFPYK